MLGLLDIWKEYRYRDNEVHDNNTALWSSILKPVAIADSKLFIANREVDLSSLMYIAC